MSLRPVALHVESDHRAKQFVRVAQILAMHPEDLPAARAYAEANHLVPEIITCLKAAVAPGSIASTPSYGVLAEFSRMGVAYLETLRNASAFDRLLPDMKRVPFRAKVTITTIGAVGSGVAEGAPKPISQITLASADITQIKAAATVVLTKELLKLGGADVMDLFERELRGALSVATDREFIARITSGLTPIVSGGATALLIRADLKAALNAVATNAASKLYWLVDSATAKSLAVKEVSDGSPAFPGMGPMGGMLCGVPVVITDGISAADNTMILVDANGIAAASEPPSIAASGQAALQMDSAPTTPTAATVVRSLFQHNETAIRVERYFGAERLGNSVAIVNGVNY